jgi:hypothetical protein
MTDLDKEIGHDKKVDELTVEELEAASGGMIKINYPPGVVAWLIAKCEAENPGFC